MQHPERVSPRVLKIGLVGATVLSIAIAAGVFAVVVSFAIWIVS